MATNEKREQAIEFFRSKFGWCTPEESLRRVLECTPSDFEVFDDWVKFHVPGSHDPYLVVPLDMETYEVVRPFIESASSPDAHLCW